MNTFEHSQTIQFLIFVYFSDDTFCIINTHLFGIYNFKKRIIYFSFYELLIIQQEIIIN